MKTNTARPRDTQPLGARTLKIHGFELGPKQFEIRGFMRILTKTQRISKILRIFSGTKHRVTRGLTVI